MCEHKNSLKFALHIPLFTYQFLSYYCHHYFCTELVIMTSIFHTEKVKNQIKVWYYYFTVTTRIRSVGLRILSQVVMAVYAKDRMKTKECMIPFFSRLKIWVEKTYIFFTGRSDCHCQFLRKKTQRFLLIIIMEVLFRVSVTLTCFTFFKNKGKLTHLFAPFLKFLHFNWLNLAVLANLITTKTTITSGISDLTWSCNLTDTFHNGNGKKTFEWSITHVGTWIELG